MHPVAQPGEFLCHQAGYTIMVWRFLFCVAVFPPRKTDTCTVPSNREYNMDIGNVIRALRLQKRMTQEDMAEALRISVQTISRWECGVSKT